jgi:hypothetical protein
MLCDKLHDLEHNYPSLVKPTDQLTSTLNSQAKLIYNKTVKEPIDLLNNLKDRTVNMSANTVQSVVRLSTESLDAALENKFAKMLTNPVLDLTERSLDYWLPQQQLQRTEPTETAPLDQQRTQLRRIYDINNRLYTHVYQTTFTQLNNIHVQFENTIKRLQTLKQVTDSMYSGSRDRLNQTFDRVAQNSLVAQCMSVVNRENLSRERLETLVRTYSRAILNDVTQMLEKYMSLVKSFPVVFNGTKLRQTIDNLLTQLDIVRKWSKFSLEFESKENFLKRLPSSLFRFKFHFR